MSGEHGIGSCMIQKTYLGLENEQAVLGEAVHGVGGGLVLDCNLIHEQAVLGEAVHGGLVLDCNLIHDNF